ALMRLAERQKDQQMAATALRQIEAALEVMRAGGHAPDTAYYEAWLPEARALVDRLKTGARTSCCSTPRGFVNSRAEETVASITTPYFQLPAPKICSPTV
ncbi:MAG: hypothetical protein WBW73_30395, partial [Rhodoplanes sp.]